LLNDFLPPKQKNEYKSLQSIDDQLNFWAEIVKANNEVLYGDFTKFSIRRRVINYFWGVSKIVKYFTK